MVKRFGVAFAVFIALGGCSVIAKGPAFKNSSVDYNDRQMHSVELPGDLEPVLEAVTTAMNERGARLLRRGSVDGHPVLVFRVTATEDSIAVQRGYYRAPQKRVKVSLARAFGGYSGDVSATSIKYGALFYFEAESVGGVTLLRALGVPTVSGVVSCPPAVQRFTMCEPYRLAQSVGPGEEPQSVPELVGDVAGVSLKGRTEAELLGGLLAELQGFRWQKFLRESRTAPPPKHEIDNAFDAPQVDQL